MTAEHVRKMREEEMPCPGCGEQIEQRLDIDGPREPIKRAVRCPRCRLPIVKVVPFFAHCAPPYGWRWVRMDDMTWFTSGARPELRPDQEQE